jgi:cell division protein FtsW
MSRRIAAVSLLVAPAVGLAALDFALVRTAVARGGRAGARPGAPGLGEPTHFAIRQAVGAGLGAALAIAVVRVGIDRVLRAAPLLFAIALVAAAAVFLPGVGVKAAGASRWIHLGPLSGSPAPFLIGATGLLTAAWSGSSSGARARLASRPLALALALLAVAVFVAQPDFSAAAVVLCVTFAAFAGAGVAGRRWLPVAAVLLVALVLGASRFGYVGGRIHGFLSPQSDRRGHGFEVLTLARAKANATAGAAGLGHGVARRHLSSPASDYAFAVVNEELGHPGAWAVVAAWAAIAAGAALAFRSAAGNDGRRGAAAGCAAALLAPAALHIAVCRGWTPIVGVTMPFLSYDSALTVASGGEIGALVAIALAARHHAAPADAEPPTGLAA